MHDRETVELFLLARDDGMSARGGRLRRRGGADGRGMGRRPAAEELHRRAVGLW